MHRRPLPPTRAASAVWARRLGLASALGALAAVAAAHHPRVPPTAALIGLAVALTGAGFAAVCGLTAFRTIWRTGQPGLGRAVLGLLLAAATLAYPGFLAVALFRAPVVTGATTDAAAPPRFSRSARAVLLRGALQAAAPGPLAVVAPITLDATAADAFDTARQAVADLHWRLVDAVAPGGRLGLGHIDAVAFSPVMHLPQDIAITIEPASGQARIDVTSMARLGFSDFGAGTRTIQQLDAAIGAQADD